MVDNTEELANQREKTYQEIAHYLHQIDCQNVKDFLNKHIGSKLGEGLDSQVYQVIINHCLAAVKIIPYIDDVQYKRKLPAVADIKTINRILDVVDKMTAMEKEYFPYFYATINCPRGKDSILYLFYELFDGDVRSLIRKITSQEEWLDIIFQLARIDYYLKVVKNYKYGDGRIVNHLYSRLDKPIIKEYCINGYRFRIKHFYFIVLSDPSKIVSQNTRTKKLHSNISFLLTHLRRHNDIPLRPSHQLYQLMHRIRERPELIPAAFEAIKIE